MTDLEELAATAQDVVRAEDLPGTRYRLESTEATKAAEIGPEDGFPEFGHFLDAMLVDLDDDPMGPRWLECPADLARELIDSGVGAGDVFAVQTAEKGDDGAWQFSVQEAQEQ